MKIIYTLLCVFMFSAVVNAQETTDTPVLRLSEPVEVTDDYEVFGAKYSNFDQAKPLAAIIESGEEFQNKEVVVTANVSEVCAKKGCFFVAQNGDKTARITFIDYSFFVPTDSQGKDVTIVGVFNEKTLTEDQAKHYAEDAGEDPDKITGPQKEFSIVATSVAIPKNK
ncbi:MAG: DUF4920 domain-containing protein [Balneolaceae bacterium]